MAIDPPTIDNEHQDERSAKAPPADISGFVETDSPDLEPMTMSLMGRLFGVPLLIIGTIVGGAVLVVLLFGGPAAPQQRSIDELMSSLEASSGEKSLGVLLPREKELWQTALELSVRLAERDKEAGLTTAELDEIVTRLTHMVRSGMENVDRLPTVGVERTAQHEVRSRRLEFLIRALGQTGRPGAVGPLLEIVRSAQEPYVSVAVRELGELHELPQSRQAVGPIEALLRGKTSPETKLVACTVLSILATPGDGRVIEALAEARLASDGEVAWSAALALARLGSNKGKSTLMDLLSRSFLESGQRYHVTDESGRLRRYALPPNRVDELLIAAMNAASHLDDPEVWALIDQLRSDSSPGVRGRAQKLWADRA